MNSDNFIEALLLQKKFSLKSKDRDIENISYLLSQEIRKVNEFQNPIYIIGGVASGKSTLANKLSEKLGNTIVISTDDFVMGTRDWRRTNIVAQNKSPLLKYDFDLLRKKIDELKSSEFHTVSLPKYDELSGLAIANSQENYRKIEIKPDYVIIEGDFQVYPNPGLQIYLHISDQIRTDNRIQRDKEKRNEADISKLFADIETRNKQQHFPFTLPCAENSDILLTVEKDKLGKYSYRYYNN